ncbi:MAG TPA: dihydroxy-acid dehydratase [Firmicutes bacterium]|nr:dihydroxy-acid dehydratase [Bacillota bacterium]
MQRKDHQPMHVQLADIAPELRPLRLASGCAPADFGKPQILIQTTAGDSHPGSIHLSRLSRLIKEGILSSGMAALEYSCTDVCDGIAQGTAGMSYSLLYREVLSYVLECQVMTGHFDGLVLSSSCDKAIPGHLLGLARLNLPSVFLPGGVMGPGLGGFTLNQAGEIHAARKRRERREEGEAAETEEELPAISHTAYIMDGLCAGPGCCAFLGTAGTMQVMAEAMGIAPWHSALCPAGSSYQDHQARRAGELAAHMVSRGLRFSDIVTPEAVRNAIVVHAAVGGSTNAVLHLMALIDELGLDIDIHEFQKAGDTTPFILDIIPSGRYPASLFWHMGGVPMVLERLAPLLHLDVLTCNGRTLGEMLDEFRRSGLMATITAAFERQTGLAVTDILRPLERPLKARGALAILQGNLAPDTAVTKTSALPGGMNRLTYPAKVFNSSEAALCAAQAGEIKPHTAVVIRYEGPKGNGMPEQFYITEAIASDPVLATTSMLITDGRFSGASRGPVIGHVSPEAAEGGPIALVADGDLISLDLEKRRLDITGTSERGPLPPAEIAAILAARRSSPASAPKPSLAPAAGRRGILSLYSRLATSANRGGAMRL